jgi:hypothetical protein
LRTTKTQLSDASIWCACTTGIATKCSYPDSCHTVSPHTPPPPPGPPPPHTAGYVVSGAGNKECNGQYLPVPHPTGTTTRNARVCVCVRTRQSTDHESLQCRVSGADAGVPIYSKDAEHQIYRYYGTWHVAHKGSVVFYDPPASSYWAPEPPLTGWRQFPNRTAWPAAPTLSAIRE